MLFDEDTTWIKLYRKLLENRLFLNADLLQLFIFCILSASHKDSWVSIKTGKGYTEIKLKEGQLIFGRNSVAKKLRKKPISTYKRMLKLKSMRILNMESNTHYTLITILNSSRTYTAEPLIYTLIRSKRALA